MSDRAALLGRVHRTVADAAETWADTASDSKSLPAGHPLRGEEWLTGPYAILTAIAAYRRTLGSLAKGHSPLRAAAVRSSGGRTRARVFPADWSDRLLLSGFTGEVWLQPGIGPDAARVVAGLGQRTPSESGGVGLVLGAGNVTAIPVLDVLYELLAFNRVSLLKVNPTQDSLVPVLERALSPLIERGLLRIVQGGAEVGEYLTGLPTFDHVHITGSADTFDRIVWGAQGHPRLNESRAPHLIRPITAELGGVSPIIVVPGRWSRADIRFQAEHVVTMRLQNSGHNCVAAQLVIVSSDWPQRDVFLDAVRDAYRAAPDRPAWYPGSRARLAAAAAAYPTSTTTDTPGRLLIATTVSEAATVQTTEFFAPVLATVDLPGVGQAFLDAAVTHANEKVAGTLGVNVIVDPVTQSRLGGGFTRAIAALRYGGVAINAWTGVSFTVPELPWGAYPGGTIDDVGSGIGVVHNALLLADVERSVLTGPFRPFPRSITAIGRPGVFTLLPKPPWFVTARTGVRVSEGLTRFRAWARVFPLIRTLVAALRA